jgi:hypothetical protein
MTILVNDIHLLESTREQCFTHLRQLVDISLVYLKK